MKTIEARGVIFGLLTTAGLIAYFFIMKWLGLVHNINLRALNAVIMFAGVYLAIKTYKKYKHEAGDHFQFMKGTGVGLITALTTAVVFSAFITGYVMASPEFMQSIKANEPQGIHINEWGIAVIIFIEAMASGFIFSYLSMQWLKENDMTYMKSPENHSYSS